MIISNNPAPRADAESRLSGMRVCGVAAGVAALSAGGALILPPRAQRVGIVADNGASKSTKPRRRLLIGGGAPRGGLRGCPCPTPPAPTPRTCRCADWGSSRDRAGKSGMGAGGRQPRRTDTQCVPGCAARPYGHGRESRRSTSSQTAPGEGVSPAVTAEMSAEDLQPTLAEGGDAAMKALVEMAKTAPGSVFEPQTVGALAQLAKADFPTWVNLRARLKSEARGVPISELDKLVGRTRGDPTGGDDLPGRALTYDEIELWEEPVDGEQLLTEIAAAIGCYVVMDSYQRDAAALWVVFAHAHDFFVYAALLVITSPVKRCGKTRLQETLARLTPRPQPTSGVTAAALVRVIEKDRPTVFIDEFDTIANSNREMGESLRGHLNSSSTETDPCLKSVSTFAERPGREVEGVRVTGRATSVAGIGNVPDTVLDRSIVIALRRKLVGQEVNRLRGKDGGELAVLAMKSARWVADNEYRLRHSEPVPVAALNDRAADAWEPLFAIADAAGGGWPARARRRQDARRSAGSRGHRN